MRREGLGGRWKGERVRGSGEAFDAVGVEGIGGELDLVDTGSLRKADVVEGDGGVALGIELDLMLVTPELEVLLGGDGAGLFGGVCGRNRPLGDHLVIAEQAQVVDATLEKCPVLVLLCLRRNICDTDRNSQCAWSRIVG